MATRNAKVEVTFAQRERAIIKLRVVVFFSPGLEMLFFIELAINKKVNGNREVSATSISCVPWMQTGLRR